MIESPYNPNPTDQWLAWARGLSIAEERLAGAIAVARALRESSAPDRVVIAAALVAGCRRVPWASAALADEERRNGVIAVELENVRPRGALTAQALAEHHAIVATRREAVARATRLGSAPAAWTAAAKSGRSPAAPVIRPPSDASAEPKPVGAAAGAAGRRSEWMPSLRTFAATGGRHGTDWRASLRAFLEDHSILLLSYVGGFLMVAAAVIYELYGLHELSGAARFAGILVLTALFGAIADLCLLSARMRVVGRTYLAVFDALLPLLAFAAWAFLGLGAKHVTIAEAQIVLGLALLSLYGLLSLQLKSPWQAALALAAVPVLLLGVAGLSPAGEVWRGPIVALAAPLYALAAVIGTRGTRFGPRFPLLSLIMTHLAVAFALGVAIETALTQPGGGHWTFTAALGVTAIAYTVLGVREREVVAPSVAAAAALAAWLAAVYGSGAGVWGGTAITPLAAGLAAVAWLGTRARSGSGLGRFALPAMVGAALAGVIALAVPVPWSVTPTTSNWLAMAPTAAVLAATAAALRLARFRPAGPPLPPTLVAGPLWPPTLIAAMLGSGSILSLVAGVGGGQVALAAALVALAGAWCVGAAIPAALELRVILRIGTVALAVGALLLVDIPSPVAAAVAFVATAVVVANAVDSRQPAWLAATAATVPAVAYWLARSITGSGAASVELTWALLPAPTIIAVIALLLRRDRTAAWASPWRRWDSRSSSRPRRST